MKMTAAEISAQLDALLTSFRTREDIERWAASCMHADDTGQLRFDPANDEVTLRAAIHYLLGIASKVAPQEYLHSDEDIIAYRRETGF